MPATVLHSLTMTTPDDPAFENKPSNWNQSHLVTFTPGPTELVQWFSAGTQSISSGTLAFANSNGVTFGMNAGTITGTVKTDYQTSGPYLTTAALSQDSSKYAGTSTGITGGSVTLDTSGIAISLPPYITTGRASTDAIGLNTAKTNVTWTVNSSGLSLDAGGYAGTGFTVTTTGASQIAATLNTAGLSMGVPVIMTGLRISGGTTSNALTRITFADGGGVSFGLNASTMTAQVATSYRASNDALGTNTAQSNVTWTANSSGVSLDARGYAGTATTMAAGLSATLNSAGLNLSVGAYLTTADLSQNSSLYFQSASLVGANTAGTTTFSGTRLNLSGGQGITLSGNVSTIVFSVGSYITTGRASTDAVGLNTANTNVTWTVNSSGISLNAGGYAGTGTSATNASITLNTNGLAISVAAPAGGTISFYENMPGMANTTTMSLAPGSVSTLVGFILPQPGSFSFLRIPAQFQTSSVANYPGSNSASFGGYFAYSTWNAVAYSLGTGASSQSLVSVASGSNGATLGLSYSFSSGNSAWSVTQSYTAFSGGNAVGTSTQFSTTSASVGVSASLFAGLFNGFRWLDINFANSLSAGPYWLIVGLSTSSTTSGTVASSALTNWAVSYVQHYGVSQPNTFWNNAGDTIGSSALGMGAGSFSTAGGGTTSILGINKISSAASNPRMYFQLIRSA